MIRSPLWKWMPLLLLVLWVLSPLPSEGRKTEGGPAGDVEATREEVGDKVPEDKREKKKESDGSGKAGDVVSETRHKLEWNGKTCEYTARAGTMALKDEAGEEKARIFYVSYELEAEERRKRPVTFAFNGGPGAASVWLHLGALGPVKVELGEDGRVKPPPARLSANPHSWLPFTDLVFVDPVGTGFSREEPSDGQSGESFYGVQEDIESVGEFVRLYLTRGERWLSPKFLVGESYGAVRAAGLSKHLHEEFGIALNGVVLVSPALDFDTILFGSPNDLPYPLFLPSYAATARYHGLLAPEWRQKPLEELLAEVEEFALGEYLGALARGGGLSKAEEERVAAKLAAYTGLDPKLVRLAGLRVPQSRFVKELLRDRRRIVGRMDSTVTGPDPEPVNHPHAAYDPSLEPLYGPFSTGINAYLRQDLEFETDLPYEFLNAEVNRSWDWGSSSNRSQGYVDFSDALHDALLVNPWLRVLVAGGYYDLATPYFTVQYALDRMRLEPELQDNISFEKYEGGHMMYTRQDVLSRFTDRAREFYARSSNL